MGTSAQPAEEKALYIGEGGNCLTDGTPLVPHETIALVGRDEAENSELWQPITDGEPVSPFPRNSPPGLTPPDPDPDEAA